VAVLPSWFAEYSLDLGVIGLILAVAIAAYGWIVTSTGRLAGILRDMSRSRRPTAIAATISILVGVALLALAFASSAYHARLAMSAAASMLLLVGLVGVTMYPIPRLWTNAYWRIPHPDAITNDQIRVLGNVYLVFGIAFMVACVGGLIGLVPKLVYVGAGFVPAAFLITDIAALVVAAVVAVKAWRLFQTVQVPRVIRQSRA
jgi:hypothetical protein